jgi:uncharacterized membrane protein (UPF0127 family)
MRKIIIGITAIILIVAISAGYFVFRSPNSNKIRISGVVLSVELATTPDQQAKGLSGRDSLPPDHGMLFVFNTDDYWSFWMNGMRFPLDILWFNSNKQAVFYEQDLQPCGPDGCPAFSPTSKAIYVLEVNAGFMAAHNVSLGDMFTFVAA